MKWQFLQRCPYNHKWFRCGESGRIACADDSGETPDKTDDGVLWLDKELPIILSSNADGNLVITTPVFAQKSWGQERACIISGLDELLYLVQEHGMWVEVHTPSGVIAHTSPKFVIQGK